MAATAALRRAKAQHRRHRSRHGGSDGVDIDPGAAATGPQSAGAGSPDEVAPRRPTPLLVAELDAMTRSIVDLVGGLRAGGRYGRGGFSGQKPQTDAGRAAPPTPPSPTQLPEPPSAPSGNSAAGAPEPEDGGTGHSRGPASSAPARLLGPARPGVQLVAIAERRIEVHLRANPQARRIILRLTPRGKVELVIPGGASEPAALRFLERHLGWLQRRLGDALEEGTAIADGTIIPFLGRPLRIRHMPQLRSTVRLQEAAHAEAGGDASAGGDELHVGCQPAHIARRVVEWLKSEARADLTRRTEAKARQAGFRPPVVTLRDTVSRWGSCSLRSGIAYSWRLILAPDAVRDYVVAHEVAHLAEMNHSPRFWAVVERLTPHTAEARAWLKRHGASLHRYR